MVLRLTDSSSNWNLEMLVFKQALSNVTCRIPLLIAAVKYITEMHIVLNCFVLFCFFGKLFVFVILFFFAYMHPIFIGLMLLPGNKNWFCLLILTVRFSFDLASGDRVVESKTAKLFLSTYHSQLLLSCLIAATRFPHTAARPVVYILLCAV